MIFETQNQIRKRSIKMMVERGYGRKTRNLLETDDVALSMYFNDIAKMFSLTVRRESEQRGLSQGNRKILMCLSIEDGISQLNLVRRTGLSAPTVSVTLARMEADNLIRREANLSDLRQVRVFLTEEGKSQYAFILEHCNMVEERMMDGISAKEQAALKETLKKVLRNLIELESQSRY